MYKALKSFVGKVSMVEGEVKDILDEEIAKDLLRAGYIELVGNKAEKIEVKEEIKKVISNKKRR